jgi:hypothetical protein
MRFLYTRRSAEKQPITTATCIEKRKRNTDYNIFETN